MTARLKEAEGRDGDGSNADQNNKRAKLKHINPISRASEYVSENDILTKRSIVSEEVNPTGALDRDDSDSDNNNTTHNQMDPAKRGVSKATAVIQARKPSAIDMENDTGMGKTKKQTTNAKVTLGDMSHDGDESDPTKKNKQKARHNSDTATHGEFGPIKSNANLLCRPRQ